MNLISLGTAVAQLAAPTAALALSTATGWDDLVAGRNALILSASGTDIAIGLGFTPTASSYSFLVLAGGAEVILPFSGSIPGDDIEAIETSATGSLNITAANINP